MNRLSQLLSAVTLRLVQAVVCALPPHSIPTMGRLAGLLWYARDARRRRRVAENLRVAFGAEMQGPPGRRMARRIFENMVRVPIEVLWFDRLARTPRQIEGRCTFHGDWPEPDSAPAAPNGAGGVVFFGHLGNWEMLIRAARLRLGHFRVVVRSLPDGRLDDLATNARGGPSGVIRKRGAYAELLRSLRAGYWVGLGGDQNAGLRGIFVPFFGLVASTYDTPARLALLESVPLDLVTAIRRPGRFLHFDVHRERVAAPEAGAATPEAIEALTAELHRRLEAWARKTPTQYNFLHRRWKDRPAGEPPGPHLPHYDHRRRLG